MYKLTVSDYADLELERIDEEVKKVIAHRFFYGGRDYISLI
jgi:hypothetical protein